ncbi:PIN domain-containing protein [Streptomyces pseudogriseolus]|uniref:PIN domain-containing protein n=1 Tax=Streptomyces pseudogriseolus TaxID=36817 RepID=UPI003FA1A902
MIFLDTNVLPRQGALKNVVMSAVLKVAAHNELKVYISEVVLEESVNIRKDLTSEVTQKLQEAFNQASKLMELEPIYIPDAAEVASSWRDELTATFEIVPLEGAQAIEALKREASRKRPARQGKGARDSAIWLSLLDSAARHAGRVHFVSDNKEDFADTANAKIFHPDLLEDCRARNVEIVYHRNLDSLLDALSKKSEKSPSVEDVQAAKELLTQALFSGEVISAIVDEFHSSRNVIFDLKVAKVQRLKSYQVDDVILSLVNLRVDFDTELADETDSPKVFTTVSCRAWVQTTSTAGDIVDIDIEDFSSPQAR